MLERFASKYAVRRMLAANGLPTVPGSRGIVSDLQDALDQAAEAGYPVLLKPSAGGGGRGMRLVRSPREMETALPLARSEAQAAFGDDSIYFEKWIEESRHVEVQVIVDHHGNGVHLGERDCWSSGATRRSSRRVRRRRWTMRAASGCATLPSAAWWRPATRAPARSSSCSTRRATSTSSRSTAGSRSSTRSPRCSPGIDLIAEQIRIAAGEALSLRQEDVTFRGHAIEFRINAEDPGDNFSPQTGVIETLNLPGGPGVRVDTHLYRGYEVPPYYDSLLGQAHRVGRDARHRPGRSRRALAEFEIGGVKTNIPFHRGIIDNEAFLDARVSTNLLDRVGPAAFVGS